MTQAAQIVAVIKMVADIIQAKREIPAGELYALLMPYGCTLAQYQRIEGVLVGAGVVEKRNNLLKWKGVAA